MSPMLLLLLQLLLLLLFDAFHQPGGDPTARVNISLLGSRYILNGIAPGVRQQCPRGLTTTLEGAFSIQQCG